MNPIGHAGHGFGRQTTDKVFLLLEGLDVGAIGAEPIGSRLEQVDHVLDILPSRLRVIGGALQSSLHVGNILLEQVLLDIGLWWHRWRHLAKAVAGGQNRQSNQGRCGRYQCCTCDVGLHPVFWPAQPAAYLIYLKPDAQPWTASLR